MKTIALCLLLLSCSSENMPSHTRLRSNPWEAYDLYAWWGASNVTGLMCGAVPGGYPLSGAKISGKVEEAPWDTDIVSVAWQDLDAIGGTISAAPDHHFSSWLEFVRRLSADYGRRVAVVVYGRDSTGLAADFLGAKGTDFRSVLTARVADLGAPVILRAVVSDIGSLDANVQANAEAFAANMATFDAAWRALSITGASSAHSYLVETHNDIADGFTWGPTLQTQKASFCANSANNASQLPTNSLVAAMSRNDNHFIGSEFTTFGAAWADLEIERLTQP